MVNLYGGTPHTLGRDGAGKHSGAKGALRTCK